MRHEPCGLLGDSEAPRYLARTDSVLGVHDQPHTRKPLAEADRARFEDGSGLNAELLAATVAVPKPLGFHEANLVRTAERAFDTVRPTSRDHCIERPRFVGKV